MCYRCQVCGNVTAPNVSQIRHVIYREVARKRPPVLEDITQPRTRWVPTPPPTAHLTRLEIEREVPLCPACDAALKLGIPFAQLLKQHGKAIRLSERARRLATPLPKGRSILSRPPNPNGVPQ